MSDDVDDQDMSFAEGEAETAPAPKAKGAGPGILKILMFVGIALGAVLVIVVVVFATVGFMNRQQKPMSAVPVTESYVAHTPVYSYVSTVGEIRTKTRDREPSSVVVKLNLGFEKEDKDSPTDVNDRIYQIRDYLRNYFSMKYADELVPENEQVIKSEIRENLNHILSKPTIKDVLFETFNVLPM